MLFRSNDVNAFPILRDAKVLGVQNTPRYFVAEILECLQNGGKGPTDLVFLISFVMGHKAFYVLQKKSRRIFFFENSCHIKEQCAACVLKATPLAGSGKGLTGKAGQQKIKVGDV